MQVKTPCGKAWKTVVQWQLLLLLAYLTVFGSLWQMPKELVVPVTSSALLMSMPVWFVGGFHSFVVNSKKVPAGMTKNIHMNALIAAIKVVLMGYNATMANSDL
eukprot:2607009-Ditylum_brightwellii.AAC.1